MLGGVAWRSDSAVWLAAATVALVAALGAGAAILRVRRREAALTLILEGRAQLPLPAVGDERERLLDAAYRRMLACSLAVIRSRAEEHSEWFRTSSIPYNVPMLRSVADDLREVEELLTREAVGVRGVALSHKLLAEGCSPLHGNDPRRLSEELHRIAAALR